MPDWRDVGFVLALGAGVLVSVEIVRFVLRWCSQHEEAQAARSSEARREVADRSGAE